MGKRPRRNKFKIDEKWRRGQTEKESKSGTCVEILNTCVGKNGKKTRKLLNIKHSFKGRTASVPV